MKMKYLFVAFLLLLMGVFLYLNDPIKSDIAPKCLFKVLTGLSCPGCGFQRCVHALLRGDFVNAVKFNLFLAIGIPYLFFIALAEVFNIRHFNIFLQANFVYLYILLYFMWFIVRNLYGI